MNPCDRSLSRRALLAGAAVTTVAGLQRGLPAQRLDPTPASEQATFDTEHFEVLYRPSVLPRARAETGAAEAESGWRRCRNLFGSEPRGRVRLDLSPRFYGATGFASRGQPGSISPDRRPVIGVRYHELDYLGLRGDYVLTHEVGHLFSGDLSGTALGEGIADWAAGSFAGLPMRSGWGAALRDAGLWMDPESFFITGAFDDDGEVRDLIRTAQYVQAGLLSRFLIRRAGWERFAGFARTYGRQRGLLVSNRERQRSPRGRRGGGVPVPEQVRSQFSQHFGESWAKLKQEWLDDMARDRMDPAEADRLVLGQRLYGAVRAFEMWVLAQPRRPAAGVEERVRKLFVRANGLLEQGRREEAWEAFGEVRAVLDLLRRPRSVTRVPHLLKRQAT